MTLDRWRQITELFHAALERPMAERSAFLDEACDLATEERAEIERLLDAHASAGSFLEQRVASPHLTSQPTGSMSGRVMDHYRVGPLIGVGGMGAVYAALDLDLGREVALKIVTNDAADGPGRLRREAQRASQLNHPNVCTIHDVGVADGVAYFVMELVEGQTLSRAISGKSLPLDSVVRCGSQIADALSHAHQRGVVHRDLKSANVMVTADGRVKVLDFGLACGLSSSEIDEATRSKTALSSDKVLAGTLAYMAPELFRARPADARTDIWSLGVVLYEMAAGRLPFEGVTPFELVSAILHQPPAAFPNHIPASLQAVIRRCLAKDPHERYGQAGEVGAAAETVRAQLAAGPIGDGSVAPSGGRLPLPRTSFIGRADDLTRCARELENGRMLTLTGVGGCGKTRLALQVAAQARHRYPDGVWWVDLTPLSDGTRVDEAIASALDRLSSQRSPRQAVLEFALNRSFLLVLDNCEHVLEAIGGLADALLATTAGVRILATSREALGIEGERIFVVPSLAIPSGNHASSLQAIAKSDAVRLFAERAAAVQHDFSVTASNAAALAEICSRLDGIPLAIELAAARARILSVQQICDWLRDRVSLPGTRGRTLSRHQTLQATLQWSYDLLTPQEQRMLRCVSVFRGGWTLPAAAAVWADNADGSEVLDLLWRLVEKSLVEVVHTDASEARYRLLEMVRQFGADYLVAAGEAADARTRHGRYYLGFCERAIPDLLGPREPEAAAALERELDNLLTALDEVVELDSGVERAMMAAADVWLLWIARGHLARGREVLERLLQREPRRDTVARARALTTSSMLARFTGDGDRAIADADASIALNERLDAVDPSGLAFALFQRWAAGSSFRGERLGTSNVKRAADLARQTNDGLVLSICLNTLGLAAQRARDFELAEARFGEALSLARDLRSPYLQILYRCNLVALYAEQGRWAEAVPSAVGAITLVQSSGNRHFAPGAVLVAARCLAGLGDLNAGVRFIGAAVGMWDEIGEKDQVEDVELAERQVASLGANPGTEEYVKLFNDGGSLTFDAAIAEALAALNAMSGRPPG